MSHSFIHKKTPATRPDYIPDTSTAQHDFIRKIIRDDLASNQHAIVRTRFPPEPNGYLHIGHAKAIFLNFGIADEFNGHCNLRLDDTNPAKEDPEFVRAIQEDVRWLGFKWAQIRYASDYFEVFYLAAEKLLLQGDAFICDLNADEVREFRGTLTTPGRDSPYRNRSATKNLALLRQMRDGVFSDGTRTLRAKIDMSSGNINLRDPALYRIKKVTHQNTGNDWPIYPMYDYAHALSDAIEGITHSLCTLEFEDHRPLYDWCVDKVDLAHHSELLKPLSDKNLLNKTSKPRQIEFSRVNLNYTILSKRKLMTLVKSKLVNGWDDPRMPTLQGIRRRGYTPESLHEFAKRIGVSKKKSVIDLSILESCLRDDLDTIAHRRMAVLNPLKLVITNLDDQHTALLLLPNHPKDPEQGIREVPFSNMLWIEQQDFSEQPPKKFKRLIPDGEVRLRGAGIFHCQDVIKDCHGIVCEIHGTLDLQSRPGMAGAHRKVKGTIHWVCAKQSVSTEIRLYDRLFLVPDPDSGHDETHYQEHLNPDACHIVTGYIEPAAALAHPEQSWQFERNGYFVADRYNHSSTTPVFNRSVTLRDTWVIKSQESKTHSSHNLKSQKRVATTGA